MEAAKFVELVERLLVANDSNDNGLNASGLVSNDVGVDESSACAETNVTDNEDDTDANRQGDGESTNVTANSSDDGSRQSNEGGTRADQTDDDNENGDSRFNQKDVDTASNILDLLKRHYSNPV